MPPSFLASPRSCSGLCHPIAAWLSGLLEHLESVSAGAGSGQAGSLSEWLWRTGRADPAGSGQSTTLLEVRPFILSSWCYSRWQVYKSAILIRWKLYSPSVGVYLAIRVIVNLRAQQLLKHCILGEIVDTARSCVGYPCVS